MGKWVLSESGDRKERRDTTVPQPSVKRQRSHEGEAIFWKTVAALTFNEISDKWSRIEVDLKFFRRLVCEVLRKRQYIMWVIQYTTVFEI